MKTNGMIIITALALGFMFLSAAFVIAGDESQEACDNQDCPYDDCDGDQCQEAGECGRGYGGCGPRAEGACGSGGGCPLSGWD